MDRLNGLYHAFIFPKLPMNSTTQSETGGQSTVSLPVSIEHDNIEILWFFSGLSTTWLKDTGLKIQWSKHLLSLVKVDMIFLKYIFTDVCCTAKIRLCVMNRKPTIELSAQASTAGLF